MKKKKVLCLAMAGAMALSMIGCGGSDSSQTSTGSSSDSAAADTGSSDSSAATDSAVSEDAVTIEVWSNNRHDEEYMTAMIAEFNATHSDVQINYTILTDDYQNSIQLAFQANTAPDIMSISASDGVTLGDYVSAGMFESLTSYIDSSADFQTTTEPYDHKYENLN